VAVGFVGIAYPDLFPAVPETGSAPAVVALALGLGFYGVIALRAARTFLLTRRRADLVVVLGLAVLAAAVVPAMLTSYMQLGWWLGHGFELIGIGMVGIPVALDLHRDAQSRPLAGDLRGVELVSAADAFLGSEVRALLRKLAEKDAYTWEHTRSVALLAVRMGDELGLPPVRLRALAIGALLHDIGKLWVPDTILQKPAALEEAEYEVIQRHPEWGRQLVLELGFGKQVARLVSDHHERLDGSGYPGGLQAAQLDLETRVLMVCDVFDALLSERVYRDAWTLDRALGLLRAESGTAFDRHCVEALERVVAQEPAYSARGADERTAA
jgi:putative nucleotidyltransferase with HDIG domain